MTYAEAERKWWMNQCQAPPVDEYGRPVFYGVRCPLPPVPVRPGFGQAAYKAGCEDEWIDAMQARYGGNW